MDMFCNWRLSKKNLWNSSPSTRLPKASGSKEVTCGSHIFLRQKWIQRQQWISLVSLFIWRRNLRVGFVITSANGFQQLLRQLENLLLLGCRRQSSDNAQERRAISIGLIWCSKRTSHTDRQQHQQIAIQTHVTNQDKQKKKRLHTVDQ